MISWWWTVGLCIVWYLAGVWSGFWFHRSWINNKFFDLYNNHTFVTPGEQPTGPNHGRECSYPECCEPTGSAWDDRCWDHSYRTDGGRP